MNERDEFERLWKGYAGNPINIVTTDIRWAAEYWFDSGVTAAIARSAARIEGVESQLKKVQAAAITGMDAAKSISSVQLEQAQRLRAESRPEALESERSANSLLTAELEKAEAHVAELERERDDLRLEMEEQRRLKCYALGAHEKAEAERDRLQEAIRNAPHDRSCDFVDCKICDTHKDDHVYKDHSFVPTGKCGCFKRTALGEG